jgi:hypothetical protein
MNSKKIKKRLIEEIKKMEKKRKELVKNPAKDFTREKKLNFEDMIKIILTMGSSSLNSELLKYFEYDESTPTSSAFVQQREKILPKAFECLFRSFTDSFIKDMKLFESYRLFAVDGSSLNIALNPNDEDTYFAKGYNQLHLSAMYDLLNKVYVDAVVQPKRKVHEVRALCDMADRNTTESNVIVIADRLYESYNVFAHIEQRNWNYVIRLREGISSICGSLELPADGEFDATVNLTLTGKCTNEIKSQPAIYKVLTNKTTFDYLDSEKKFYPMSFRVVRFKVSDDLVETVITNLDSVAFPAEKLKMLYNMRWGIETSFRELKYTVGLACFHAKKTDYVYQEIFARLTMYNFYELITMNVVVAKKNTKHIYQVNFTAAVQICRHFFRTAKKFPVDTIISKYILPVKKERKYQRKIAPQSFISFNYRLA